MRREPTELSLANSAARTRGAARVAGRSHERSHVNDELAVADVMDQAFADFSRVDVGAAPSGAARSEVAFDSKSDPRDMTKELVADIAVQLRILDRQREQLTALLRSVEVSNMASELSTR